MTDSINNFRWLVLWEGDISPSQSDGEVLKNASQEKENDGFKRYKAVC